LPNPARNRTAQPRCCWVPSALRGGELKLHLVHVLNVNPLGARLLHLATSEEAEGLAKAYLGLRTTQIEGVEPGEGRDSPMHASLATNAPSRTPPRSPLLSVGVLSPRPPHATGVPCLGK
jgi:hypothetical protein